MLLKRYTMCFHCDRGKLIPQPPNADLGKGYEVRCDQCDRCFSYKTTLLGKLFPKGIIGTVEYTHGSLRTL